MARLSELLLGGGLDDDQAKKIMKDFKKQAKEATLDAPEKLLVLYYLGFFDHCRNIPNTGVSEVLSPLFNASAENIRKMMSNIQAVESETNLRKILPVFEKAKIEKAVREIKAKLEKFEKANPQAGEE